MVLLGVAIFVGWIILGLLLQLACGGSEEENAGNSSKATPGNKP